VGEVVLAGGRGGGGAAGGGPGGRSSAGRAVAGLGEGEVEDDAVEGPAVVVCGAGRGRARGGGGGGARPQTGPRRGRGAGGALPRRGRGLPGRVASRSVASTPKRSSAPRDSSFLSAWAQSGNFSSTSARASRVVHTAAARGGGRFEGGRAAGIDGRVTVPVSASGAGYSPGAGRRARVDGSGSRSQPSFTAAGGASLRPPPGNSRWGWHPGRRIGRRRGIKAPLTEVLPPETSGQRVGEGEVALPDEEDRLPARKVAARHISWACTPSGASAVRLMTGVRPRRDHKSGARSTTSAPTVLGRGAGRATLHSRWDAG